MLYVGYQYYIVYMYIYLYIYIFIYIYIYYWQVVYVAPMKALAAEMVRNFGTRLAPLGVTVKELTGDMQLTKSEIQRTQVRVDKKCG